MTTTETPTIVSTEHQLLARAAKYRRIADFERGDSDVSDIDREVFNLEHEAAIVIDRCRGRSTFRAAA